MSMTKREAARPDDRRSLWVAALIGVGVMAAIDEIVFHRVLGWHHFYDRSTTDVGLLSDGLLHAAELVIIVGGFSSSPICAAATPLAPPWAWAGFFIGREHSRFSTASSITNAASAPGSLRRRALPYDLAWNASGVACCSSVSRSSPAPGATR